MENTIIIYKRNNPYVQYIVFLIILEIASLRGESRSEEIRTTWQSRKKRIALAALALALAQRVIVELNLFPLYYNL